VDARSNAQLSHPKGDASGELCRAASPEGSGWRHGVHDDQNVFVRAANPIHSNQGGAWQ
jgi:hypothetical protein